MIRSMARQIARNRIEQAGIKKPVKKGFFRKHWKEYVSKRRRK